MLKYMLLILTLLFFVNFSKAEGETPDKPSDSHQIQLGTDRVNTILQYNYGLTDSWHLRAGFFSNIDPDIFNWHFNAGIEYRFLSGRNIPAPYAGVEAVMLNRYLDDEPIYGGGVAAGIRYNIDRFSIALEQGAAGYQREIGEHTEFRWMWHRETAIYLGWLF